MQAQVAVVVCKKAAHQVLPWFLACVFVYFCAVIAAGLLRRSAMVAIMQDCWE